MSDEQQSKKRLVPKPVRRALQLLGFALVVYFLVIPQFANARGSLGLLTEISLVLLGTGIVAQIGAYLAHVQLTRTLLPPDHRPTVFTMARIELSSRAVSHVIPGGTAAGTALGYHLLRRRGVPGPEAGFATGAQGIGSAVVLNALLWLSLLVSIPLRGVNPYYGTAAALGVVVIGTFSALVISLWRAEERSSRAVGAVFQRVPFVERRAAERVVHRIADRLRELSEDRTVFVKLIGWACAHWLLDALSLWVMLRAFGVDPPVDGLLVAFGIANVLAAIPITPRGLGVVEATLLAALVGFGLPTDETLLAVITYRLVSFWLPIPLGALSYLSFRVDGEDERGVERLKGWLEDAADQAESVRDWATRHGLLPPREPSS